ncbi:MAG: T9SS C-terminal target domain-containing protein, partial [Cytophagales bacterium]|nr:T9SS C-terminal target domain-containing protein [Cytophagales bacterium]
MPRSLFATAFFFFLFLPSCFLWAGELVIAGVYQGKNVYVQNPFTWDMKNFCTREVYVNDKLVLSNPKASAYEINLSAFQVNQPVVIKIIHENNCAP